MFKDMLGQGDEEETKDYLVEFRSHFVKPQDDFNAIYQFRIQDKKQPLVIKIQGGELTCDYMGTEEPDGENVDVYAKLTPEVMEKIIAGRMTFQGAFMTGEMTAKGNFKTLRMLDQIFIF